MNRVKPIEGERGRFFVESKSRKGVFHLVDIVDFFCGCEAFNENHFTHGQECSHIKLAKEYEAKSKAI